MASGACRRPPRQVRQGGPVRHFPTRDPASPVSVTPPSKAETSGPQSAAASEASPATSGPASPLGSGHVGSSPRQTRWKFAPGSALSVHCAGLKASQPSDVQNAGMCPHHTRFLPGGYGTSQEPGDSVEQSRSKGWQTVDATPP